MYCLHFPLHVRGSLAPVLMLVHLNVAMLTQPAAAQEAGERAPEAAAEAAARPPLPEVVEVTVRARSEAERLRRSAEAVSVVETKDARRQTADLGEVLARTSGVAVQRAGGLGSDARFSLNGLTDDQIRFFIDGVPLELAGFQYGIANVPVNLIERAEVFRGVVPIRFGADALGGAVNLVSAGTFAPRRSAASLQLGSFGTVRLTGSTQYLRQPSGWFTRVTGSYDRADNDYPMNIEVANASGQLSKARVYRFHDGYRGALGAVETGVIDRKWADRLLLRVFVSDYDKQIQNDPYLQRVYGGVTRSDFASGATLRFEHSFRRASVSALAGYAYGVITFKDLSQCNYNWFGQCISMRAQPGEIKGKAQDQIFWTHSVYGRLNVELPVARGHSLTASLSPTYSTRSGDERKQVNPDARDLLDAQRDLFGLVSALDYKLEVFGERLENVLFVKDYVQVMQSEQVLTGQVIQQDRNTHRAGLGDSLRYTIASWLHAKGSYEWATRLPRLDEIFGGLFPVNANLELKPEVSHNVNLEVDARSPERPYGVFHGNVNGFLREVDNLIQLVGAVQSQVYQNVYRARSRGLEVQGDWTAAGGWLTLAGNTTYVNFRNTSDKGAFAQYPGDRIPNRPYLFANGSAKLTLEEFVQPRDELSLIWASRYVHGFYKGFESNGLQSTKLEIPAQLVHSLALIYAVRRAARVLTMSVEAQNLTDAQVFDFFGVPRPGRAVYFKMTASL
jgi:vitamin B12 transporter